MAHFAKYNANRDDRNVEDCTVRAISTALDEPWEKVYVSLCVYGMMMADMPHGNEVWYRYLKDMGFRRHIIPDTCPDCYTVEDFCHDHPNGTYIVSLPTHVVCVIDGTLYDTWDSSQKIPIFYWEKEA